MEFYKITHLNQRVNILSIIKVVLSLPVCGGDPD